MDGRKLKDHVIQVYQAIKQVFSHEERQYLFSSLKIYKSCHDAHQLAQELYELCTSPDRTQIVRDVWGKIIHGNVSEFDEVMREFSVNQLRAPQSRSFPNRRLHVPVKFKTGKLFDDDNPRGNTRTVKIHKTGQQNLGFCIRGGLEHGLGIYVSGVEEGFAADEGGLHIGDKILEANSISLHRLPSSSAIKVLTGSNQLKLLVESTGRIPEWRLSRERTVWYDCETGKLTHGNYDEYDTANYVRGIDVDIPERCVTWAGSTDNEDIGFNIRGGNEYRLGIYVSNVDEGSIADRIGIHTGDQIIDVNGIPFDNISHAHAVETLKTGSHLIMTLRDVGRFPAYKEIYADYTWTGTSIPDENSSIYSGERLIERKLPDTWIESGGHKKKKNLLLRVPVDVISQHDMMDHVDPLHPEIYLPEGETISHNYDAGSSINSTTDNSESIELKPVDTWIKGSGHVNPAYQSDERGDNSSISSSQNGEYSFTMDDIINKNKNGKRSKFNVYDGVSPSDNVDFGYGQDGQMTVERFIMDGEHFNSTKKRSEHGKMGLGLLDDDIKSESLSRDSLMVESDLDSDAQSYHSNPSFSTFSKKSGHHKGVSTLSLGDWKKSVDNLNDLEVLNKNNDRDFRESNTDAIENRSVESDDSQIDDNFAISIVQGSAYKQIDKKKNRYKKREQTGSKSGKNMNMDNYLIDSVTNGNDIGEGQIDLYEPVDYAKRNSKNESSDDPSEFKSTQTEDCENTYSFEGASNDLSFNVLKGPGYSKHQDDKLNYRKWSYDMNISESAGKNDYSSQADMVLNDFDYQIETLEGRKSDLGMFEMSNIDTQEIPSPKSHKKSRRGSLFKNLRKKSTDMTDKQSSWKIIKRKIRSGLFKKANNDNPEDRKDFVWTKTVPDPFNEALKLLEAAANELFDQGETEVLLKNVKTYHDDHNIDILVDYLLDLIDIPEKILILKDVRQVIYKFDRHQFDELVKQFEIDNYEQLSTKVPGQLNHDKRRKPKKYILHPETDEFGHFYIKPTTNQKELQKEKPQSSEEDSYRKKYGQDIIITYIPKYKETLGLCVSGGIECKKQPQIKVEEILPDGAAADEPNIQPGMILLAIDDTDLREATHTDAILTLKKSFNTCSTKSPFMHVVLSNSVVC